MPGTFEHLASSPSLQIFFDRFELACTIIFGAEMLVHMAGSLLPPYGPDPFLRDAWNYFDVFVVSVSVIGLVNDVSLTQLRIVRALRVFRVLRLTNRFPSMKRVADGLLESMRPVCRWLTRSLD